MDAASDTDEELDSETWMLNLQELLDTLEPQIRDLPSNVKIEDILANLEVTDSNFHRYSFVKLIKGKLESDLGPLIDYAVTKHDSNTNDSTLVTHISAALLKSKEFHHTSRKVTEAVKAAASDIIATVKSDNFDFFDPMTKEANGKEEHFHAIRSICSTISGVDFMFLPPDRYKDLVKDIDLSKPVQTRLQALSILQHIPQTDLVTSDAWEATRSGVLCALDDEIEEVHLAALRFISRLFICGSVHVVHEYFLLLIENLIDHFNDSTSHMINIDSGLDLGDRRNVLLLRKFYLLNQIQRDLPSFWLRYSEKYINEMIQGFITLLDIDPKPLSETFGERLISPLHFISIIDPNAVWFKKWSHGYYGRSKLLKYFNGQLSCLIKSVECCYDFSSKLQKSFQSEYPGRYKEDEGFHYSAKEILYTYFLHSLNLLGKIMLYEDGRNLLQFQISNNIELNVRELFLLLAKIILTSNTQIHTAKSDYHYAFIILEIFRMFSKSGREDCLDLICDINIINELINALRLIDPDSDSVLQHVICEILREIMIHQKGRSLISKSTASNEKKTPICSVFQSLSKNLNNGKLLLTNSALSLLSFCREIYSTPDGIIKLMKNGTLDTLSVSFKELKKQVKSMTEQVNEIDNLSTSKSKSTSSTSRKENIKYKIISQFEKELYDFLISFALTPKGVAYLCKTNTLTDCVSFIFNKQQFKSKSRLERFWNGMLLNEIAATPAGVTTLGEAGKNEFLL